MLYNASRTISFRKEELLDIIDELEVYTYYLGFRPTIDQTYISPLRQDKSPSFNLFYGRNGRLMYKDFGTGESGDCFKFAARLTNQHPRTINKEIKELFTSKRIYTPLKKKKVRKIPSNSTDIDIKKIPYNKEGIQYWNQYGIDDATLFKYDVFQTKKVWINGELKISSSPSFPIFTYLLYDRMKIYMPKSKGNRFITNSNMYYIQGWKQLNKERNTLIITKSLKDVMLLDILGYSAIAPNAESYSIPNIIVTEIKKHFDNIILLYDRDLAGMLNTRKIIKSTGFNYRFIPKKYQTKDITDFYKGYGKAQTVKLLSNLI